MLRFSLVNLQGLGTDADPIRPNLTGHYVVVVAVGNRAIVKHVVPDGTTVAANTLADVSYDTNPDGKKFQVDVISTTLAAANRTTIKTFLTNNGIPNAWVDASINTRKKLLVEALKRLANRLDWDLSDMKAFLLSYDVSDEAVPHYDPPYIPPEPVFDGIPPPIITKLGEYYAVFRPRRTEDLKATELIGQRLHLMAGWVIEGGEYQGEWAMVAPPKEEIGFDVVWIPSGDLTAWESPL